MAALTARIDVRRMQLIGRMLVLEERLAAGEAYGFELDAIRDELEFLLGLAQGRLLDAIRRVEQARPPVGVAFAVFPCLTSARVAGVRAQPSRLGGRLEPGADIDRGDGFTSQPIIPDF